MEKYTKININQQDCKIFCIEVKVKTAELKKKNQIIANWC